MDIDFEYYTTHIDEWCRDDDFYQLRTKDQICSILINSRLNFNQFSEILNHLPKFYNPQEIFEIIQNIHINTNSTFHESSSTLQILSQLLRIPLLQEINLSLQNNLQTSAQNVPDKTSKKSNDQNTEIKKQHNQETYQSEIPKPSNKNIEQNQTENQPIISIKNEIIDNYYINRLKKLDPNNCYYKDLFPLLNDILRANDLDATKYAIKNGYLEVRNLYY